jgi:hypothetical protein
MNRATVIARGYRGRPLQRVVISRSHGLVYVAAPDSVSDVEAGDSCPIGFPETDIFLFDSIIYADLCAQWNQHGSTNPDIWHSLRRYRP